MIIIGERAYLKAYEKNQKQEIDTDNNVNKVTKVQNDQVQSTKVNRKESKTANNDMYNNLKSKASILCNDKRAIQDKVSEVQTQQQKVENMEESLNQIKSYYISTMSKTKQEGEKEKVKINKIQKQVDELNNEYTKEVTQLTELEDIIQTINLALNKINNIKNKLEQYKSKLISLEHLVQKSKQELEQEQNKIDANIDENIISNPLDFINISGDISTGIIIDIKI